MINNQEGDSVEYNKITEFVTTQYDRDKIKIMIIATTRVGDGIGHVKRCKNLMDGLDNGKPVTAGKLIVLDYKKTPSKIYNACKGCLTVGIDEGGRYRKNIDYLIDILPFPAKHKANIKNVGFLELPKYKKRSSVHKTLVSFGGEDPKNLTSKVVDFLVAKGVDPKHITAVIGKKFKKQHINESVTIMQEVENLIDILYNYDVVYTAFGLTAFEAAASGAITILLNPTKYHSRLSRDFGFSDIGICKPVEPKGFHGKIRRTEEKLKIKFELVKRMSLSFYLNLLSFKTADCPVCEGYNKTIVVRFVDRNICFCKTCGVYYVTSFLKNKKPMQNDLDERYKLQYGKRYIDDLPDIIKRGTDRVEYAEQFTDMTKIKTALDIGCAYGSFMVALAKKNIKPTGIEINGKIVESLTIKQCPFSESVINDNFLNHNFGYTMYDLITAWFVLEHFEDVAYCIYKISTLIYDGGSFWFSVPNGSGISARRNLAKFLQDSPSDHLVTFRPQTIIKLLKRFGFAVQRIRITGHHGERFPFVKNPKGLMAKLFTIVSKVLGLGDTFEIYAKKVKR